MIYLNLDQQNFLHLLNTFKATEAPPIDAEKEIIGYSAAWMHHKGHNPHHWEYWVDFDKNGKPIPSRIPYKYVVEMICDYVAAGMTYSKEKWTQTEPLRYFNSVIGGRHFHPETERLIRMYLGEISNRGVETACKWMKHQYYSYDWFKEEKND